MFSQPFFPPPVPPNHPHFAQIRSPFAPIAAHHARNSISLLPGQPLFPVRHKKQLSIGGPPKAVLGGPQRKPSPLPPSLNTAASTSQKQKKVVVNLPKETIPGHPPTRAEWARNPIDSKEYHEQTILPVEATSQQIYPPDNLRRMIPDSIDVFLPSQHAWDALKQQVIEEKLRQLGVERGSGSNVPHIYAPHARAASISSPADPALLMFKLNKLQQQQRQDGLMSPLLASPQPPLCSSSPRFPVPIHPAMIPPGSITNRHGHTLSLVQPPSYQPPTFDTLLAPPPEQIPMGSYHTALSPAPRPTITINPSAAPLNSAQLGSPQNVLAPAPALSAVHPRTRLDFIRGFGLETPEEIEEEEEEETKELIEELVTEEPKVEHEGDDEVAVNVDDEGTVSVDATTVTGPLTRIHSRHESKLSASLSVPSRIRTPVVPDVTTDLDIDAVSEWTGSEDLGPSDNESIGEWSNPSDEEQARQERAERRTRRRLARQQLSDKPRRIPNFPRPPAEPNVASISRHQHRLSSPQPHFGRPGIYDHEEGDEDIISNPSEEARLQQDEEYLAAAAGNVYTAQSPIPQLNHIRSPSIGQYSGHDPAQAHSRTSSDTFGVHYQQQLSSPGATLNPCAKPFVFGSARQNPLPTQTAAQSEQQLATPPNAPRLAHSPLPSMGDGRASISSVNGTTKPLNVSAPEFRPAGFTFRPPPGVPQMPTLQASNAASLGPSTNDSLSPPGLFSGPLPPLDAHPPNELQGRQGREKRQRRNSSSADLAIFDEGDSMRSFRFPANLESPKSLRNIRRSMSDASVHQRVISSDKENVPGTDLAPFAHATCSTGSALPSIPLPRDSDAEADMEVEDNAGRVNQQESNFTDDSTAMMETRLSAEEDNQNDDESDREEGTSLFKSRKRPPLPLDFTQQPTRKNTVPAGLFKALASANSRDSGDDRTRKSVRSRLSSRDFFEEYRKPSLDDLDVPRISSTLGRGRFVTDPESTGGGLFSSRRTSDNEDEDESDDGDIKDLGNVFAATRHQQHRRRGSSLPSDLHDVEGHEISRALAESPGVEVTTREDMQNFESRLVGLMEDKFMALECILRREESPTGFGSKTEVMIGDMVSLFRAQLQESATRSLEDSQMDARGEMDFQLIKDIIDEGHKELATTLRKELMNAIEDQAHAQQIKDAAIRAVEDVGSRTVGAIVETVADFAARHEAAVNRVASAPARERDTLVEMVVKALSPVIAASSGDTIDYEFLTSQLAQAVKPHISQLIDLASDKRETAGLIVDRILPLLPFQGPIDIGALTLQVTTEVRRAIAPIDAHEIKEQVADLVIERLDSRLAVRDKGFNVDTIAAKVAEGLSGVFQEPVANLKMAFEATTALQQQQMAYPSQLEDLSLRVTELPAKLAEQIDGLASTQDKIMSKLEQQTFENDLDVNVNTIMTNVNQLIHTHKVLEGRDGELLSLNKEILEKLLTLPDALLTASTILSNTHSELSASLESSRREVEELRKLNTDYQVQMAKARGAHGQVRVEKDVLNEKLIAIEAERERLRGQIQDLQSETSSRVTEFSSLKTRVAELEEAHEQALGRLQAADVSTSTNLQRLTDLEQANNDLKDEKRVLQATIESLNIQLDYAGREKDAANQSLGILQKKNDELSAQQTHWDSLRLASEKIDVLTNLIGQADNEELKELRQIRDRANALEVENASLQKHSKEIESKLANSEKVGATVRQTLTQAQQRSTEWERRAKEAEGQLEFAKTKLEQSEQTQMQMEADLSLIKLQLEEREAGDRLAKDREGKLRDQIAELEARTTRLHTELEKTQTPKLAQATAATAAPIPFRLAANDTAKRPQSRTSTMYDLGSPTPSLRPVSQASFNSGTPPASVWDSMHAPKQPYPTPSWSSNHHSKKYPYLEPSTPRGRHPQHYTRPTVPSPTPSTVSLAPTQGEDGWWS